MTSWLHFRELTEIRISVMLTRVKFALSVFGTLLAGLFVGVSMFTGKSGKAFYHFSINSRSVPSHVAGDYWERALRTNPSLQDLQDADQTREIVWSIFHEELKRMKWTWDSELDWDYFPEPATLPDSGPAKGGPP